MLVVVELVAALFLTLEAILRWGSPVLLHRLVLGLGRVLVRHS